MRLSVIFLLFVVPVIVFADDLKTRDGRVYPDYKIISHDAAYASIIYRDGGMKIEMANLPAEVQVALDYNADKAKEEMAAKKIAQIAEAKKQAEEAQRKAETDRRQAKADEEASKLVVYRLLGTVMQKTADGYLVDSNPPSADVPVGISRGPDGVWSSSSAPASDFNGRPYLPAGRVFVTSSQAMVDDDRVSMLITPSGEFSYTSVLGAQKTVRKYDEVIIRQPPKSSEKPFNPGSMNPP